MQITGHLFIIQADMRFLAADAFLIPCDGSVQVSGGWRSFVDAESREQPDSQWHRVPGVTLDEGIASLTDPTPEGRCSPDRVVGRRVLVDTVSVTDVDAMIDRYLAAVKKAAEGIKARGGRTLPLVAMTVPGVGQGAFQGRRAEVIRKLIMRTLEFVASHEVDVALVVSRDSDFAAAQWARQDLKAQPSHWSAISPDQQKLADELGTRAARGQLSIFVGAGVSKPVGFPDWKELLEEHTHKNLDRYKPDQFPALAQRFKIDSTKVAERFNTKKYALGHALLVNLRTKAMVTTNYDPCLENASRKLDRALPLRVLTRELAIGGDCPRFG